MDYTFMDKGTATSERLAESLADEATIIPEHEDVGDTDRKVAVMAVAAIMKYIGADMEDPNCIDTPERVIKAWETTWAAGYKQKSSDFLTVFPNDNYDEMVIVQDIPVHSTCSHHLAPITGFATIAIIPGKDLIGLSKYARIVDMFARRLQLQERLTVQIADEIERLLHPLGVAVYIKAEHGCMSSRGVKIHGANTITSCLRGVFRSKPEARAEFMSIAQNTKGG